MGDEMAVSPESIAADLAEQLRKIGATHEELVAPLREHRARTEAAANSFRFGLGEVGDTDARGLRRDLHDLNELTAVQGVTIVGLQASVQRLQVQLTALMRMYGVSQEGLGGFLDSAGDAFEAIKGRLDDLDGRDDGDWWKGGDPG